MSDERFDILLVEDNPDDVALLQAMLRESGGLRCEITVAGTLEEGLKALDAASYSAMLLDLHLPDSQGMETFYSLRTKGWDLPIIVVTVLDLEDMGVEAVRAGAQDYLVKDHLTGAAISKAVRHGIERMALRKELVQARDHLEKRVAEQVQTIATSELRFRSLVEQLHEGVWELDKNDETTFVNPRMAAMLGYRPEEMLGRRPYDFMKKGLAAACKANLDLLKQGGNDALDFELLHKDGSKVFVYLATRPLLDENGKYTGALASVMDVTERRMAEMEIESLSRFPRENPNPILRLGMDGSLVYANEAAQGMLKYFCLDESGLLDKDFCSGMLHEIQSRAPYHKDIEIGGKTYGLTMVALPEAGYVNIYGLDITERVRAKNEVDAYSEKLSRQMSEVFQLYESMPLGMCLVTSNLEFIRINSVLAEIHNFPVEYHLGKHIQDILSDSVLQVVEPLCAGVLADGEIKRVEFHGRFHEGQQEKRWWQITVYPVSSGGQEVFALGGIVQDITAQKQAQEMVINSRNLIKGLLDAAPDRFMLFDLKGKVLALNTTSAASWGMTPSEMVGKNVFNMHPDDLQSKRMEYVDKVRRTKRPLQFHDVRDGVLLESHLHPLMDESGNVDRIAIFSKDVTEQTRAREELTMEMQVTGALSRLFGLIIALEADVREVTPALLDEVKALVGAEAGHVGSIDEENGDLVVHTYTKMLAEGCPVQTPEDRRIRFPRGEDGSYSSLMGHSLNTLKPHYTNYPDNHPASTGLPKGHVPIDNFLGLPVMLGDALVGQIALSNKPEGFSRKDVEIVKRFGEFFALAIQRSRALDELKASEKRYKSLYQAMYDGFVTMDMDGRIIESNDAFGKMLGYTGDEVLGKKMDELTASAWLGQEKFIMRKQVLARGYSDLYDKELVRKDGEKVAVSVRTQLLTGEDGTHMGLWAMVRDVTERRQAEVALRQSEEKLREAQKIAHLGHWEHDLESGEYVLSMQARMILGLTPGQDVNSRDEYMAFVHPEDRELVARKYEESLAKKTNYSAEYRIVQPGGEVLYVHDECRTDYGFSDQPLRSLGMIQDITVRKKAETVTREYSELLGAILEGIEAAVFIIDLKSHKVVEANSIAQELMGSSQEGLVGTSCRKILKMAGDHHPCNTLTEPLINQEDMLMKPDGTEVPVLRSILPVTLHGRAHIVETVFDLTDRKKLESQLMLAQKMESIGQLSAGIAHEINTPMQYVGDNVRFLREAWDEVTPLLHNCQEFACTEQNDLEHMQSHCDTMKQTMEDSDLEFHLDEAPKAFEQTVEGIERVVAIVQAMKRFSHPGEDEMKLADINNALQNTTVVSRNEWKYHADIDFNLDPKLPPVPSFLNDLNQVFLNIIVNAAQAIATKNEGTGEKGTITISTGVEADMAVVRIADTGTGIEEENIPRVFDHFFTTKEVGKGTGQGLSLAYSIITEKHNGTLTVESEYGKGATFIISLPLGGKS